MDPVILARLQFALTIGFHFIFPPITIGLAWLLVIAEGFGWRKKSDDWVRVGKFFGKLFALTFAIGVATGIVMEFQFGTNWAHYSKFVGDIFGAPLAAEGIFAFFLESSFLGLYLFGRNRVSKGVHWFSILMVAVGATFSAFWIIVANSWQQTPDGYILENGRAELVDFAAAVFNPSTLPRYFHTIVASLITGAFFMGGISAYLVLKKRSIEVSGRSLKLSVGFGIIASFLAVFPTGHFHAEQVARTQPEKFAAIEGLYDDSDSDRAPMVLFALPFTDPPELKATVEIPGLLGFMAFGDPNAEIKNLRDFPPDEVPKGAELWLSFVSFHNMVILGMFFIGMMCLGALLIWKKREQDTDSFISRWWLKLMVVATFLPVAANEFGWVTAEVGRQPWIVYKMLRTADGISATVSAGEILTSIIMFGLIYLLLGALWLYLLATKINMGPPGPAQIATSEIETARETA
ncbi:MAG: cytochrome ubiquinol oxidase subunit I [Xanthomonadales bacterium]|nr:cytochrome ubiquinol oxidase subunit I [Xanthomonadales bacterium]MDX2448781.1 cytochrome ubiquinol oxidase subunit I [Desulfobacterales bacterium]